MKSLHAVVSALLSVTRLDRRRLISSPVAKCLGSFLLLLAPSISAAAEEDSPTPPPSESAVPAQTGAQDGAATPAKAPQAVPLHRHPILVRMLARNNHLRERVGLRPHRLHPQLTKAAQDHANYMARTHDFNHYSNGGPWGRASKWGFRGGLMENIAMGYADVDAAFAGWQSSGGHWSNMASDTAHAGFGYQVSASGTPYWVAVYGTDPEPAKEDKPAAAKEKGKGVGQDKATGGK